jgi:hypothetical protein
MNRTKLKAGGRVKNGRITVLSRQITVNPDKINE